MGVFVAGPYLELGPLGAIISAIVSYQALKSSRMTGGYPVARDRFEDYWFCMPGARHRNATVLAVQLRYDH